VGWFDVVMAMPYLDRPPHGLLAELDSLAALLEVPSPKGLSASPIISLEHYKIKKQFE
jgi:hypothetical protein